MPTVQLLGAEVPVRIVHVGPKHPLCSEYAEKEDLGLPPSGRRLLTTCGEADAAVTIRFQGHIIAFFRYFMQEKGKKLGAAGTWVDPQFRRQGLATLMWQKALSKTGAKKVGVVTVSAGGRKLVDSLKNVHKDHVHFGKLQED